MVKDLISYRLAQGVSEEHLLHIADLVAKDRMSKQSGFISWELHKSSDGSYTDIVSRETQEDAKKAEASMTDMPHASEWHACYEP